MKNLAVLLGCFLLFNSVLSGTSSASSSTDLDCYDCGSSGWQKMNIRCSTKVSSKHDFISCLKTLKWSKIPTTIDKVISGFIEIGGNDLLSKPSKKSISVFSFDQWACDQDGNLYLMSVLG